MRVVREPASLVRSDPLLQLHDAETRLLFLHFLASLGLLLFFARFPKHDESPPKNGLEATRSRRPQGPSPNLLRSNGHRLERNEVPAVMIALINDLHEARINDLHKVGHRYIDFRAAERKASREQLARLPTPVRKEMSRWVRELLEQSSRAAVIARDADLLECMVQGKEYSDQGHHPRSIDWMKRPAHLLKTKSAKRLARALARWKSDNWWQNLVRLDR